VRKTTDFRPTLIPRSAPFGVKPDSASGNR
jgi:hypothetical protein